MNFQQPAIALLDDIYQAASKRISSSDPQHASETYLKVLIEPLAKEARAWVNASFTDLGDHVHYEVFRQLAPSEDYSLPLRKRRYLLTSWAIAYLLAPNSSMEPQTPPDATVADCLHVVCQKPKELIDFLNIYIAIASPSEEAAKAALADSVAAAKKFLLHFSPYYYVAGTTSDEESSGREYVTEPPTPKDPPVVESRPTPEERSFSKEPPAAEEPPAIKPSIATDRSGTLRQNARRRRFR